MVLESHAHYYASMSKDYLTPEQVDKLSIGVPRTSEEHAMYAAADCMISERHAKDDLVHMLYAIFKHHKEQHETTIDHSAGVKKTHTKGI